MEDVSDLVSRSAVAAGPMSRAVERIEPMAIDERPTATAMATMNARPTHRVRIPRADASSGESDPSKSGRWMAANPPRSMHSAQTRPESSRAPP